MSENNTAASPVGPLVETNPALRPESAILEGRLVYLEPLNTERHSEALFSGTSKPENAQLWAYLGAGPFDDREAFDRYLSHLAASNDPFPFAIVDRASRKAVGMATYLRIEPSHRVIEVGHILFTPAIQHTTGATEAMYLMVRNAFERLGYRRYEWKCNALNAASRRLALRLGFQFEGVFRQHMIVKGRNRDTAWYSMIDSEWPRNKQAFERWLDPENFDARGWQRLSLTEIRDGLPLGAPL